MQVFYIVFVFESAYTAEISCLRVVIFSCTFKNKLLKALPGPNPKQNFNRLNWLSYICTDFVCTVEFVSIVIVRLFLSVYSKKKSISEQ